MQPLSLIPAVSVRLSVTNSSSRVSIGSYEEVTLKVSNTGTVEAFFDLGDSTVVATTASPGSASLLPGEVLLLTKMRSQTHLAALTASGATTISVSIGAGN